MEVINMHVRTNIILTGFMFLLFIFNAAFIPLFADEAPITDDAVQQKVFRQPAEVVEEAAQQLQITPDDLELRLKYADALFEVNKIDQALDEYKKINKADKKNADALLGIACCNERKGYPALALSAYRSACNADPWNAAAVNGYMTCALKNGRLNEVLPYIKQLAQKDKHNAAACYYSIASSIVKKDYWKAQAYAKEAHKIDPKCFPDKIEAGRLVYNSSQSVIIATPGASRLSRIAGARGTAVRKGSSFGGAGRSSGGIPGGDGMVPPPASGKPGRGVSPPSGGRGVEIPSPITGGGGGIPSPAGGGGGITVPPPIGGSSK
jgi:hypothetical protein